MKQIQNYSKVVWPKVVWLEPTTRCNAKCFTCPHSEMDYGDDMDRVVYDKVVNQILDHADEVILAGGGEPLMGRDFVSLVDRCVLKNKDLELTTNGTLLDNEIIRKFVENRVRVCVSMDGATVETYNAVRPNISFKKVLYQLEMIRDISAGVEDFFCYIRMVVMKRNMVDVPKMVELAHRYNIKMVHYTAFNPGAVFGKAKEEAPERYANILNEYFKEAHALARKLNVLTSTPYSLYMPDRVNRMFRGGKDLDNNVGFFPSKCFSPWQHALVRAGGNVYACCLGGTVSLGNLKDSDFEDIWNGQMFDNVRCLVNTLNPPVQCRRCHLRHGITQGHSGLFEEFLKECFLKSYECVSKAVEFTSFIEGPFYDDSCGRHFVLGGISLRVNVPFESAHYLAIDIEPAGKNCEYAFGKLSLLYDAVEVYFDNSDGNVLLEIPDNLSGHKFLRLKIELSQGRGLKIFGFSFYSLDSKEIGIVEFRNTIDDYFPYMEKLMGKRIKGREGRADLMVFGANENGIRLADIAKGQGYNVIGFVDNYKYKDTRSFLGLPVYGPGGLKECRPNFVAIASIKSAKTIAYGINKFCEANEIEILRYKRFSINNELEKNEKIMKE